MNSIQKAIEEEKDRLLEIRKRCITILGLSPEGSLHIHNMRGKTYYYLYTTDQETGKPKEQYISENNKELIPYIKKYCAEHTIKAAELSLKKLLKNPNDYDPDIIQQEYRNFESMFGDLTPDKFITKETIMKRWQNAPYKKSTSNPIPYNKSYTTDRGERVRSKIEQLCANCLNRLGIPYHYEEILILNDGTRFAPDFTILSPKDRKKSFIEIMGMMSVPEYLERNSKKLEIYGRNGIIPGDNLLLFYEFDDLSFDMGLFEKTVTKKYLE